MGDSTRVPEVGDVWRYKDDEYTLTKVGEHSVFCFRSRDGAQGEMDRESMGSVYIFVRAGTARPAEVTQGRLLPQAGDEWSTDTGLTWKFTGEVRDGRYCDADGKSSAHPSWFAPDGPLKFRRFGMFEPIPGSQPTPVESGEMRDDICEEWECAGCGETRGVTVACLRRWFREGDMKAACGSNGCRCWEHGHATSTVQPAGKPAPKPRTPKTYADLMREALEADGVAELPTPTYTCTGCSAMGPVGRWGMCVTCYAKDDALTALRMAEVHEDPKPAEPESWRPSVDEWDLLEDVDVRR